MLNVGHDNELLCICFLLQICSLSGVGARFCLSESLHHQMWSIGTGLYGRMVAMVVARQLKWLYNQLKVLTVSRIPYILVNLSSDSPWSEARSIDSSRWCLIVLFLLQPSRVTFLAWV